MTGLSDFNGKCWGRRTTFLSLSCTSPLFRLISGGLWPFPANWNHKKCNHVCSKSQFYLPSFWRYPYRRTRPNMRRPKIIWIYSLWCKYKFAVLEVLGPALYFMIEYSMICFLCVCICRMWICNGTEYQCVCMCVSESVCSFKGISSYREVSEDQRGLSPETTTSVN